MGKEIEFIVSLSRAGHIDVIQTFQSCSWVQLVRLYHLYSYLEPKKGFQNKIKKIYTHQNRSKTNPKLIAIIAEQENI